MNTQKFDSAKLLSNLSRNSLMLHLTGRKYNGDLFSVTPTINKNVQQEIIDLIEKQISYYDNQNLKQYDIVGSIDDTVEYANSNDYINKLNEIFSSLKQPMVLNDIDPNSFDFFTYEFKSTNGKPIYVFRKINRMKALKKGILGEIANGSFTKIKSSKLLGIDNAIDFIVIDDKIFIFHHISLERVLKLNDQFKDKAKDVLSNDEFAEKIKNFDELKKRALENGNYVKRLAKLYKNDGITAFLEKIDRTKSVIDQFNLDIEVNKGQLIYRDETQIGNFVNLMQDSYYKTLIGNQNGIDEKR
ncbi:Kiwa anti-phage protein KwaB-like domain-containing protein [Limosilactobacillus vaginalis]|uniref:Kiwa anti-phage protein KwaB-like domain-containing protein n=1 Tax=Limosilactobacillus vaginalis TaxID=1633 RepID=UPI0038900266